MNSSERAGPLNPLNQGPDYDEGLERALSKWIRYITDMPAGMVRPRWTPVLASMPAIDQNWCAFGLQRFTPDDTPAFENQTEEKTELWRHEAIECLITFYGPDSQRQAARFRDGLTLGQNNDELNSVGLSVAWCGETISFPEQINSKWVRRYDMTLHLRRKIIREYGIKTLVDAPVKFFGD